MSIASANDFFRAVKTALKLPPNCTRLVIEADFGKPLKIYVCGFVPAAAAPALAEAVLSVAVGADGEVSAVPFERDPLGNIHIDGAAIDVTKFESR